MASAPTFITWDAPIISVLSLSLLLLHGKVEQEAKGSRYTTVNAERVPSPVRPATSGLIASQRLANECPGALARKLSLKESISLEFGILDLSLLQMRQNKTKRCTVATQKGS